MKRSKRHALAAASAPKPPPTPRQLSRWERERRNQLRVIAAVGVALLVAALLIGYGYWREVVLKGGEPIAEVGGQQITTEQFARYWAYQRAHLEEQVENLDALAEATPDQAIQYQLRMNLALQRLQYLDSEALSNLIDAYVLRREAEARGLQLPNEAIDAELIEEARSIRGDSTNSLTGPLEVAPSATPAATPPELPTSAADAMIEIRAVIARSGDSLTEEQVRELVVVPRALRKHFREEVIRDVPTTAEQVHARHILVQTEEEARSIEERIAAGEDFAALARELSTDTSNKEQGGDLGWFPRGVMVSEFEKAAFDATPPADATTPPETVVVQSSFGWHVLQVLEKDADRPLDEEHLLQAQERRFNDWLSDLRRDVTYHYTADKVDWARGYVDQALSRGRPGA